MDIIEQIKDYVKNLNLTAAETSVRLWATHGIQMTEEWVQHIINKFKADEPQLQADVQQVEDVVKEDATKIETDVAADVKAVEQKVEEPPKA